MLFQESKAKINYIHDDILTELIVVQIILITYTGAHILKLQTCEFLGLQEGIQEDLLMVIPVQWLNLNIVVFSADNDGFNSIFLWVICKKGGQNEFSFTQMHNIVSLWRSDIENWQKTKISID